MKYKNNTKGVLKFRAFNPKMEKVVFIVKPEEVIETGKEMKLGGMILVEKEKENRRKTK